MIRLIRLSNNNFKNSIFINLILLVIIVIIYIFTTYNSLVKLKNQVKDADATLNAYLKKRWDLIPNLVETVKGYAAHEKNTLLEIIQMRKQTYSSMSEEEKTQTNKQLSRNVNKLLALAEAYPELKANENFMNLSNQLKSVEEDIVNARKYYNATVRIYNNKVEMIPSNIVANIFGFKLKNMFEMNEEEKENVKVSF